MSGACHTGGTIALRFLQESLHQSPKVLDGGAHLFCKPALELLRFFQTEPSRMSEPCAVIFREVAAENFLPTSLHQADWLGQARCLRRGAISVGRRGAYLPRILLVRSLHKILPGCRDEPQVLTRVQ